MEIITAQTETIQSVNVLEKSNETLLYPTPEVGSRDENETPVISVRNHVITAQHIVRDQKTNPGDKHIRAKQIKLDGGGIEEKVKTFIFLSKEFARNLLQIPLDKTLDVWGFVIDPKQITLKNGLYQQNTESIKGEYELKFTYPDFGNLKKVLIVEDNNTKSRHLMKEIDLRDFKETEISSMWKLNESNVTPQLFGFYLDYRKVHLHMEYLPGYTMENFVQYVLPNIRSNQQIGNTFIFQLWFFKSCMKNILEMRKVNISHRDLTPGNVMVVINREFGIQTTSCKFIDLETAEDYTDQSYDVQDICFLVYKTMPDEWKKNMEFISQSDATRMMELIRKGAKYQQDPEQLFREVGIFLEEYDPEKKQLDVLFEILCQQAQHYDWQMSVDKIPEDRMQVSDDESNAAEDFDNVNICDLPDAPNNKLSDSSDSDN